MLYPNHNTSLFFASRLTAKILNKPQANDCILMQYTGLKDKNGNEIYEGDIVKYTRVNWYCPEHPQHNTDLITICEIFWSDSERAFRERGKFDSGGGWEGYLTFADPRADENIIEVIGNIYENPELLEDKNVKTNS